MLESSSLTSVYTVNTIILDCLIVKLLDLGLPPLTCSRLKGFLTTTRL